ncbi:MAG: hypothetical protein V2G42_07805 [bacterium JZ-2024 1]
MTNKQSKSEGHKPRLPLNEAIGVFERAFRKSAPELVEHQLREMLHVQVIVAKNKQTFESDLLQNQSFPPQITLPFYMFCNKYKNAHFSVYRIDLEMFKEVRRHKADLDAAEGALFSSDFLVPCCSEWDLKPGHTYVIISDHTGYSSEIGLTFGEHDDTPTWTLKPAGSKEPFETTSRYQTFEEHARAVSNRSQEILKTYQPFIKKWASQILEGVNPDQFSEHLCTAIQISALYHDVGKLSRDWQCSAGWQPDQPFIARTHDVSADKRRVLPKHAPYAYPFIKTLLRNYFEVTDLAEGRILDHIALATAKHHNIEVMGNIQRNEFHPADEQGVLRVLKSLAGEQFGEELARHIPPACAALMDETRADEPPGPSEDFYFLYCIAHRAIKMADWEDAGNETLELMNIRQL